MKIDVIVVPDFEGPSPLKFEYTTNLFLASWLEHESHFSNSQLHVVSVGKPPISTRRLVERANAELTVCAPFPGNDRFRNKLNGFKATPTSDHFMLLDTDVVLFQSIDQVSLRLDSGAIALGYANGTHLSLAQWRVVYDRLGLPLPPQRVPMVLAAFGNRFSDRPLFNEFCATVPYYNGGVVVAPWSCELPKHWERLLDLVPSILQSDKRVEKLLHRFASYDQPPLAIASEILQSQGVNVRILPDALHARWQHFCLGLTTFDDVLLAHTNGIFGDNAPNGLRSGVSEYSAKLRNVMDSRDLLASHKRRLTTYADRLETYLLELHEKWIAPGRL